MPELWSEDEWRCEVMARYIDADSLLKRMFPYDLVDKKQYALNAQAVYNVIESSSTADVVPVVYCKDCKHLTDDGLCFKNIGGVGYKKPRQDDFCSYGERRET